MSKRFAVVPGQTRDCVWCGKVFERVATTQRFCSRKCRNRSYYSLHKERWAAAVDRRERYQSDEFDPRRWFFLKQYGITPQDYLDVLERQGGVCAICNASCPSGRRLGADHDHQTKKFRGLLCSRCNTLIGLAHENQTILKIASAYLEAV